MAREKLLPAWKLIRKYARLLTERVSLWISGSNKHTIRKCLRQWEAICRKESLGYLPDNEESMMIEITTLLTYHVMDGVHHLRSPQVIVLPHPKISQNQRTFRPALSA